MCTLDSENNRKPGPEDAQPKVGRKPAKKAAGQAPLAWFIKPSLAWGADWRRARHLGTTYCADFVNVTFMGHVRPCIDERS
jgi:hypothetical protein